MGHDDFQKNAYDSPSGPPWAPRWLVDVTELDYFGHVVTVTLGSTATNALIAQVGCFNRLERLNSSAIRSSVGDDGMRIWRGLPISRLSNSEVLRSPTRDSPI